MHFYPTVHRVTTPVCSKHAVQTVLQIKVVNCGSVVVDNNKLVDAAELADQRHAEVRLDLAHEVFRTCQLTLCRLSFCDSHI